MIIFYYASSKKNKGKLRNLKSEKDIPNETQKLVFELRENSR